MYLLKEPDRVKDSSGYSTLAEARRAAFVALKLGVGCRVIDCNNKATVIHAKGISVCETCSKDATTPGKLDLLGISNEESRKKAIDLWVAAANDNITWTFKAMYTNFLSLELALVGLSVEKPDQAVVKKSFSIVDPTIGTCKKCKMQNIVVVKSEEDMWCLNCFISPKIC